jgi:polygalacturonase
MDKNMDFTLLAISNRSVTVELDDPSCYFADAPYELYLNGELVRSESHNIATLHGLQPGTGYTLAVRRGEALAAHEFITKAESVLLNVRRFGARGDGQSHDTAMLQSAILACPPQGTVYVPQGVYRTGPLFLKSEMTLWLEEGAVLLGDTNRESYPILPGMTPTTDESGEYNLGTWEGNPLDSYASLLTGLHVHDVDIIGSGMLDANAQNGDWWIDAKVRKNAWRPRMLFLNHCEDIRVQGVTAWTVHPYYSKRLQFLNLTIQNHEDSPNTDGIDPESSEDVAILGCHLSTGDDCIAIKSGKLYQSVYHYAPTRGVEIRNCLMCRGHGGVVIGSEIASGVYDVHISHCLFRGTDKGLRIKTRRGRGHRSVMDGVVMEHVRLEDVAVPFTINMFYHCDPDGHSDFVQNRNPRPVEPEVTPVIGTLRVRDASCTGAQAAGGYFFGLPEMPIGEISLTDVDIAFAADAKPSVPIMMDGLSPVCRLGLFAENVERLCLCGVTIRGANLTTPTLINVTSVTEEGCRYDAE